VEGGSIFENEKHNTKKAVQQKSLTRKNAQSLRVRASTDQGHNIWMPKFSTRNGKVGKQEGRQ